MDRRCLFAGLLILFTGCAGLRPEGEVVRVERPAPPADGKVRVGKGYVDFVAPTLDGSEIRLSSLVGRHVVLLQFWGIRCAPCLAEMQFLSTLQQRFGGRGLRILAVNTDRVDAESLKRAMERRNLSPPFPVLLDPDFGISRHYTRWLIPVTVLIDRKGVVRAVHTGYRSEMDELIMEEVAAVLGGGA